MIDCLIVSKDRAAQLQLLMRSIQKNFSELTNVSILVKSSNQFYEDGYIRLIRKSPNYKWYKEKSISDIRTIINSFENKYTVLFVDDEVVVNDYKIDTAISILDKYEDVHCFSLRMHPRVDFCYTANLPSPCPKFEYRDDNPNYHFWKWSESDPRVDWGYPSCINSHIYRTDFIKHWINKLNFDNVNNLEGGLNHQREHFKPYMICYNEPKTINLANNLTQTGTNRFGKNPENTLDVLNKKYLEGYIIDYSPLHNLIANTPTFEYDYILMKE